MPKQLGERGFLNSAKSFVECIAVMNLYTETIYWFVDLLEPKKTYRVVVPL